MALIPIPPVEAHVGWDRRRAAPAWLRWAGHAFEVVELRAVRDERRAFPREQGPRITYLLQAADGSLASAVYDGRRRRWYVEAIEPTT